MCNRVQPFGTHGSASEIRRLKNSISAVTLGCWKLPNEEITYEVLRHFKGKHDAFSI